MPDGFISWDMRVASRLNFRFQKWSELTLASSIWGTYWLSRLQQCQITSNKFLKGILGLIFQIWKILEKTLGWYDWIEIHLVGWLVGGWRTIRIISEEEARWISPPRSQWLCCNSKISGGDYRLLRRIQQLSHSRTDFIKSAMSLLSHCTVSHVIHVTCDTLSSALSLSHHFLFRLGLFAGITPWLRSCNSLLFVLTK